MHYSHAYQTVSSTSGRYRLQTFQKCSLPGPVIAFATHITCKLARWVISQTHSSAFTSRSIILAENFSFCATSVHVAATDLSSKILFSRIHMEGCIVFYLARCLLLIGAYSYFRICQSMPIPNVCTRHKLGRWANWQLQLCCAVCVLYPHHTHEMHHPGPACSKLTSLRYNFTLEAATLDQSILNPGGSSHRFNIFLKKLILENAGGRTFNVVVLGGSFSSGQEIAPGSFYALRLVQHLRRLNSAVNINLTNSVVSE